MSSSEIGGVGMNEKEHVLIIDDDPNIAKSLAIILQQRGDATPQDGAGQEARNACRRAASA